MHVDLHKYLSVQYLTPSSKSHRTFNVCFAKEEATGATALPALSGGPKFVAIGVLCQLPNEDITWYNLHLLNLLNAPHMGPQNEWIQY